GGRCRRSRQASSANGLCGKRSRRGRSVQVRRVRRDRGRSLSACGVWGVVGWTCGDECVAWPWDQPPGKRDKGSPILAKSGPDGSKSEKRTMPGDADIFARICPRPLCFLWEGLLERATRQTTEGTEHTDEPPAI